MINIDQFILSVLAQTKIHYKMQDFLFAMQLLQQVGSIRHRDFLQACPEVLSVLRSEEQNYFLNLEKLCERDWLAGYQFTFPGHELYPSEFYHVDQPPMFLQYQGSPVWLAQQGLSVVGSREPSAMAQAWFEDVMSKFLQQHQLFTVSGGARGVDQMLHRYSIRHSVPSIAVLPSGLGQIYPYSLLSMREKIFDGGGALVSEYPSYLKMQKHHFISRNRLIAALGLVTLVIEARHRSGTLITARYAIDQHRPVLVVPSHPLDLKAQGGLELITEGAGIARDAIDLQIHFDGERSRRHAALRV